MNILNILLAILVFSIIIIFHEFGHFIVAKWNKIAVIEFSLGMGPRLISWAKTKSGRRKIYFLKSGSFFEENEEIDDETIYSWKILPFGGSCMMLGEEEELEDERAFGKKSVYARMAVIFAGPFFNFILAFILSLFVIGFAGYAKPTITGIADNSAASEAGLQQGDEVVDINGHGISANRELRSYLMFHPPANEKISMTVERDGEKKEIEVTPKLTKQEDGSESYKIGISYSAVDGVREKVSGFGLIKYSWYEVKSWIVITVDSLWQMATGHVSMKDVSGPVGIVKYVGDSVEANAPSGAGAVILNLMNISILLTANLGVMNLLPIPALDGGRLLFLIIEWIRRKPLNPKVEGTVNFIGFALLMVLMVLILGNDIFRIIG